MRTRTLLLLALACGVAILAAGVGLFVKLGTEDEPAPPADLGADVAIGDLDVVVASFVDDPGVVGVVVELGGVDDPDAVAGFRLVVPGASIAPAGADGLDPPACAAVTVADQRCTLRFPLPEDPGTTRVLVLRRGEEQVRWDLVTT